MPLDEYRRKRDFSQTPEPDGDSAGEGAWSGWTTLPQGQRFCIQMHRATRMHFDVRLEHQGVLLSWACPRGPSLDPADKRLAVRTEDHPIDYGDFEGVIPSGYGMGTVMLWDVGTFQWTKESAEDPDRQIAKGDIKFRLEGTKVAGEFALVHIGGRHPGDDENAWLLIKKRDENVVAKFDARNLDASVRTGRALAQIATEAGGDPRIAAAERRARPQAKPKQTPVASPPISLLPMLATPQAKPFSAPGWFFEVKYDGVRALLTISHGVVTVIGRSGRDETKRYPEAQGLARLVGADDAVIDAEIVALDAAGRPSFEALQQRININHAAEIQRHRRETPVTFACFDILRLNGRDLTKTSLRIRKKTLRDVLKDGAPALFAEHLEAEGEALFEQLRQQGIEGMVAKRADSIYQPGVRSSDWLKVKAWQTQSCVICGFTAGRGNRGDIGALILGVYQGNQMQGNQLRHCGQAGSGLDGATSRKLKARLLGQQTAESTFQKTPKTAEAATWTRPTLVCEVRHAGWTRQGLLRHPTFLGLREDVDPQDCQREVPSDIGPLLTVRNPPTEATVIAEKSRAERADEITAALERLQTLPANAPWEIGERRLRLTHLDKVLWPEDGITKRNMIDYYVRIAPQLLPYLADRPLSMQVFPDGILGKSFWRKDKPSHAPEWIRTWTYHGEKTKNYIVVDSVATLAWVANAGVIDLHPWHSRIDIPDTPDWAVFDLDPFEPATFADVVEVARLVHAALEHYGLRSVPKTSGQTGLQIYVPLRRGPKYDAVRGWVEEVGRAIGQVLPEKISWEWTVSKRTGKIRIDYTQNIINKTLAAPYSLRPVAGAPVSTPLRWDELEDPTLDSQRWNWRSIHERIATVGDLFSLALQGDQDLPTSP